MLAHIRRLSAEQIGGLDPRGLDGIGRAVDHLLHRHIRLAPGAHVREILIAVRADALGVDAVEDVVAVDVLELLGGIGVLGDVPCVAGDNVAAGDVEVAGDAPEIDDGVIDRRRLRHLIEGQTPVDGGGVVRGVSLRRGVDDLRVDAGDLRGLFEGVGLDLLGELIKAVAPLLDELVVIPVVFDDEVQHAHRERAVRAGADLEEVLGAGGEEGPARVDDDQLASAAHAVHDPVALECIRAAARRVLRPDHDIFRQLIARVVEALLKELRAVGHREIAHRGDLRAKARGVAGLTGKSELGPVRAAVRIAEEGNGSADVAARALNEDDGLGTVLLLELGPLLLDGVVSLVPADFLPLALAALADALQGLCDAVRVVDILRARQQTRAGAAVVPRMVRVALDLDDLAVLDVKLHAAAAMAAGSGGPRRGLYDFVEFNTHCFCSSFSFLRGYVVLLLLPTIEDGAFFVKQLIIGLHKPLWILYNILR